MADTRRPILLWFRQDLRLADNPALTAAVATGRPIVPLFVLHHASDGRPWGAASLWWLDKSLRALDLDLRLAGSRLILRRGDPAVVIPALAEQLGAEVYWNRLYGPAAVERDGELKAALDARSFNASLLVEPWRVKNGSGEPYRVFTPFWKAAETLIGDEPPQPAPPRIPAPEAWPAPDFIDDWGLQPRSPDWSKGFGDWRPGEKGAQARLEAFVWLRLDIYPEARDRPDMDETSGLSAHLHWGEIGPRQARAAVLAAVKEGRAAPTDGAKFIAELGWREFNHSLLHHHGDIARRNIRRDFDRFGWRADEAGLAAWKAGRTGYPIVDAGMRQLWATGYMHNRVRMIAASFLIKHLLIDWREGEAWFWDTLVDADEANNPANWQWSAGCGADAQPFFRIFNPVAQGERFDPLGDYVRRWVPELRDVPAQAIHRPWEAGGAPGYPAPVVDHAQARARALEAFARMRSDA
jgi:deoxyribodipyrimidine photo-lyase